MRPGSTPRAFRDTLGQFASGITVIGGLVGDTPTGFTCQSFYSVSVEPPLVSFSVKVDSTTYPNIRDIGRFSVNVLAHDQDPIADQFARRGTDKWAGVDWTASRNRNPIIAGTLMWLDCDLAAEHAAGDHYIVVGSVNEMSPPGWHVREPLLYFRGRYRRLCGHRPVGEPA
ncbi:flavin reductase [Pseudonocardia sp. CNS-004]|nr:flavin reductase [Pseudonocardia sp. CNS-004]